MEARRIAPGMGMATFLFAFTLSLVCGVTAHGQFGAVQEHVAHSTNFIVFAATPDMAARAAETAERLRRELAIYWLGEELPTWSQRCPVRVIIGPQLPASGETRFAVTRQQAGNWMMIVNGTEQRVMDSVLPHEITHTIFATHFAQYDKYVPRWADEGACTTVEHEEEKAKHRNYLQKCLRTGRGLTFNRMFSLKDYPSDILPLYAQGHSVVQFLLDQHGPRKFISFLEKGLPRGTWELAMRETYEYQTLGEFQLLWNNWLRDGSPNDLSSYAPSLKRDSSVDLASATSPVRDVASLNNTNSPTETDSNDLGLTSLANNDNALRGLESASFASGPSWYRQRLRAVGAGSAIGQTPNTGSGVSSDNIPVAGDSSKTLALQAYQPPLRNNARPQPSQGVEVRVLDWGNSQPISGLSSSAVIGSAMSPLLR